MRNSTVLMAAVFCTFLITSGTKAGDIPNDGGLSGSIYGFTCPKDWPKLDWDTSNDADMDVDLLDIGAFGLDLAPWDDASAGMRHVWAMLGPAAEEPTIAMCDGSVSRGLLRIANGALEGYELSPWENAAIYPVATDFEVDGIPLVFVDEPGGFGTLIQKGGEDIYAGAIAGALANASDLDNMN